MVVALKKFIETENAFAVMAELRKLGYMDTADMAKAIRMNRPQWIAFMKELVGIDASS